MKKLFKNKTLWVSLATLVLSFPVIANDAGSGMYSWYNAFWGDQQDRDAIASCDVDTLNTNINGAASTYVPNGGIGIVNISNLLFCQLEHTLGVSAATDSSGVTGHFTFGSDMYFHAVVTGAVGAGAQLDGTNSDAYDFQADIWGCRGSSSACASVSAFSRLMRVFWTKDATGAISKGKYYMDQSVMNGMSGAYLTSVKWDMGTAAANRYTEIKTMCTSSYCNPATNWYGYHHVAGDKIDSQFYQTHPGDTSTSDMEARFAAAFDLSGNIAATVADFVQIASPRAAGDSAKNDAITYNHCLSRVATADGEDWDYSNSSDCSSLPAVSYPNVSIDDVDAWTASSLNGGVAFGNMTSHPANLN